MRKLPVILISIGLMLVVGFVILGWVIVPMLQGEKVVQGMQGFYGATGSWEHWKKFGLPSHLALNPPLLYVYLFNVTNPQYVIDDGVKPILQQIGPYVYTIQKIIEEIPSSSLNDSNNSNNNETETELTNDKMTFKEKTIYHFNSELSRPLTEDDEIMTLNVPFVKFVEDAGDSSSTTGSNLLLRTILISKENANSLFIQRPVKELLFSGFAQPSLNKSQKSLGHSSSPVTHDGKFGFFYPKNESMSKLYTVFTSFNPPTQSTSQSTRMTSTLPTSTSTATTDGDVSEIDGHIEIERQGQIHKQDDSLNSHGHVGFGRILSYDGKSSLDYWAKTYEDKCNRISGTTPDGMLFHPLSKQGSSLSVFRPEMCRPLTLRLSGHVEDYNEDGLLKGYRYILPPDIVADSKDNLDNNCYCPNPNSDYSTHSHSHSHSHRHGCVKAGTLSNCRDDGSPYITSLPHFLDADESPFLSQTVGLLPDRAKHGSYIDLEPITGLALKSSMKFQLNYPLKLTKSLYESLRNVPDMLFPILWTNEVKLLNFILSGGIEKNIMTPLKYIELSKWGVLAAGCILIAIGFLICLLRTRKKNYPLYFNTLLISKESLSPTAAQRQKNKLNRNKSNRKVSFASKIARSSSLTPSPSYGEDYEDDEDFDDEYMEEGISSATMPSSPASEPFLDGLQRQASRTSKTSKSSKSSKSSKASRSSRSSIPSISISTPNGTINLNPPTENGSRNGILKPLSNSSSIISDELNSISTNLKKSNSNNGSIKSQSQSQGSVKSKSSHKEKDKNKMNSNIGKSDQGQGQTPDGDENSKDKSKEKSDQERITEISVLLTSDETMV